MVYDGFGILNNFKNFRNQRFSEINYEVLHVGWSSPQEDGLSVIPMVHSSERSAMLLCRGALRDASGAWPDGFTRKLGSCSIIMAELWGVQL